jgi:hypothetical protein
MRFPPPGTDLKRRSFAGSLEAKVLVAFHLNLLVS